MGPCMTDSSIALLQHPHPAVLLCPLSMGCRLSLFPRLLGPQRTPATYSLIETLFCSVCYV